MITPNITISIDIGLKGAISFFDTVSQEVLSIYEMPTFQTITSTGRNKGNLDLEKLKFILEIPKEHKETALVVMEDLHAFPGQGVVAIATLLEQKGIIRGLSKGLGYDELLVNPKTWQKYFNLIPPKELKGKKASQTKTLRKKWLKSQSMVCAIENFPSWESKIKDYGDGVSDALLIGLWKLNTPVSE